MRLPLSILISQEPRTLCEIPTGGHYGLHIFFIKKEYTNFMTSITSSRSLGQKFFSDSVCCTIWKLIRPPLCLSTSSEIKV